MFILKILLGPLVIPAIAAGTALLGTGAQVAATGKQNKKSRAFTRQMYEYQRQDNLRFWQQQNEYNSPQAQMKRLQEAGLNPNLVYGQSSGAAAGQAQLQKTPDVQTPQFRTPDLSGIGQAGASLLSYYDVQIKQAQTDNLKEQNTVLKQESLLKAAQILSLLTGEKKTAFDLGLAQTLKGTSIEAARANVQKTLVDTKFQLSENERRIAMNASNLQEAGQRILSMRAIRARKHLETKKIKFAIIGLRKDNTLKALEIQLQREGITKSDPIYWRIFARHLDEILSKISGFKLPGKGKSKFEFNFSKKGSAPAGF